MVHLGDITKISGYDVQPVDCVIGGSPCQDLSIAGKRAGLAGARSGLFMEQIRVIKELRDADRKRGRAVELLRPRYMLWENVPGAFSSNGGEDFRAVIEETARVAEQGAVIPRLEGGRWRTSGCIVADGWSIAWRVLDAQFWGVPQRRRRIALVADFGGQSAPEILFVRKSVCGDIAQSRTERENAAERVGAGTVGAITVRIREGCAGGGKGPLIQTEKSGTLGCHNDQTLFSYPKDSGIQCLTPWDTQSGRIYSPDGKWHCLNAGENAGQARDAVFLEPIPPACYDARGNGDGQTVCTITGDHEGRVTDYTALVMNLEKQTYCAQSISEYKESDVSSTMSARDYKSARDLVVGDVAHTLRAMGNDPHREDAATYPITNGAVRRLTPLECERLQGFPDGWTDIGEWTDSKGRRHQTADAARYKALGNSIAIPPWTWVLKRLCACYERPATMASLFDGIGGFPLIWERLNGPGTCLWASEIEEFPIAVTKAHFGG